MSPSSLMGTFSDTQTLGRKRVASGHVVEKTVERRQKRMIKNRESAARSRARKQAYTQELELKISRLEEENERLRRQNEEFEVRMSQIRSQTSSCSSSQSPEDLSAPLRVWADVAGGKKKGCLYGAGDLASNYKKGTSRLHIGESSSSGAATGRSAADEQEIAELKWAVAEQQRAVAEQQEETHRTNAILAQVLAQQDQMYQLLACKQPPLLPLPPSTDDHVDDADGVEHLDHDQDYQDY